MELYKSAIHALGYACLGKSYVLALNAGQLNFLRTDYKILHNY